jgi:pilus assembly protein CpaE
MLTVAIVSGDTASSAQIVAALQQTGIVKSIKEWTIPGTRVPDTPEGVPDFVLLDLGRDTGPFFRFAAHLRRIRPATRLIAVSAALPPTQQLLLEAMRSGVQEFIPLPISMDTLKEMLSRWVKELDIPDRPSHNKVIVVMGSKGGVGTTTVAVNLGVQLSVFARKRVVLLDFARPLGNAHLLLDLRPKFGVRDAVDNLERLDSHLLGGLLTQHSTKMEILAGATQPEEWQTIAVPPLERIVNVAQNNFDVVLVDMGSQFSTDWSAILKMTRMILIIAEANVPSLWTLQRRLVALTGFGIEPDRVKIILNRWHKGDEEIMKGIHKDINRPVFACIPNDFRKASTSVNLGTPLLENGHNNGLSLRYRQMAAQIAGVGPDPAAKKSGLGGFFSFQSKSQSKR